MARGGFPGGGGMNMQQMLKQAQQMQQRVQQAQDAIAEKEMEASVGGGMVKVTITGEYNVKDIEINPQVVDPDEIEELQDLLTAAVNQALTQVTEFRDTEMSKVTGGMNLGGLI